MLKFILGCLSILASLAAIGWIVWSVDKAPMNENHKYDDRE